MPIETASTARSVSAIDAVIMPAPGGPTVVGVVEQRFANGVEQEIALATDTATVGQNMFRVRLLGAGTGGAVRQTALLDVSPSRMGLDREVRETLPGMPMERSAYFAQNSYGPFGYMLGHSGVVSCLFAWQRIGAPTSAPAFGSRRGAMDLRLRYCGSNTSDEALLDLMYGFTIVGLATGVAWNPYPAPIPADPRIGFSGTAVRPAPPTPTPTVAAGRRQAAVPTAETAAIQVEVEPATSAPAASPAPVGAPPPPLASVVGVVVPPPPTGGGPATSAAPAVLSNPPPPAMAAPPAAPELPAPAASATPSGPVVPPPPATTATPQVQLPPPPVEYPAAKEPVVPAPTVVADPAGTAAPTSCGTSAGNAEQPCKSTDQGESATKGLPSLTKG